MMNAPMQAASEKTAPRPCFYTLAETARELRCSRAHLGRILAGRVESVPPLPVLRIGRRVLIRAEALREWTLWLEARESEEQRASGLYAVTLERRAIG